jgi:hypothetical protein
MKKALLFISILSLFNNSWAQFEGVLTYKYGAGTSFNYIRKNWSFIQFVQENKDTLLFWYDSNTKTLFSKTEKNSDKVYKNNVSFNSLNLAFQPLNEEVEIKNNYSCLQGMLIENTTRKDNPEIHVWYVPGAPEPAILVGLFKNVPGIPIYVTQNGDTICELLGIKKIEISSEIFNLSKYTIIEINDEYMDIEPLDEND